MKEDKDIGRIMEHSQGMGVPTPRAVEARALEIARSEGRGADEITTADRTRARREVTGASGQEPEPGAAPPTAAGRDPAAMVGTTGGERGRRRQSDEQTVTAREVQEGMAEAEHERRVASEDGSRAAIAIAADHAGFPFKQELKADLETRGYAVVDFGTDSTDPVDYPDHIRPAALAVATGQCSRGIVIGGSGNGEAIVSNKVSGIRCAVCWNEESARLAREHNNANMISLGARLVPLETARTIVQAWLTAEFQGGRHARRIAQIE